MRKVRLEVRPLWPREVETLVGDAPLFDSSCGEGARVYYAEKGLYVKEAAPGALQHEANMGRVFWEKGLGPEVILYLSGTKDYMVTREVPGQDLTHFLEEPLLLCREMGEKLRKLHAITGQGLPAAPTYALYDQALARGVNPKNFQKYVLLDSFAIASPETAFALARQGRDALSRDTLIHGDACLPNFMMEKGRITSFIDFAASGAGDRHIDLFWAVWSLAFNLKTEKYTAAFLDAYGRDGVEMEKVRMVAAMEALG